MFVQRLKIEGFSGFKDSGWIELSPKLNVVVGTNNSGKSSLLQAISGETRENPHKRPDAYLSGHLPQQKVLIDAVSSKAEFLRRLAAYGNAVRTTLNGPTVADAERLKTRINTQDTLLLKCETTPQAGFRNREPTFPPEGQIPHVGSVILREGQLVVENAGQGRDDTTIVPFLSSRDRAIFHFPAERYHTASTPFGRYDTLSGNASNLAGFLQYLQGNDFDKFEEVTKRLKQVIPSIERVTIDTLASNEFNILVWPQGSGSLRELAFPLDTCGTGVSQLMAIFAAVVTKRDSCIIVDEINSFLHPSAVKDMLGILSSEYPTNQYVISSHSSEVMSHPAVSSLLVVERDHFDSNVRVFQRSNLESLKSAMRHVGISMADVLGAEAILWVEGPTESIAFPNLYRDYLGGVPESVKIVPVSSTGDFEGTPKDKKALLRIYDGLLETAAPLASGQCFLLDKESLNAKSVAEIERQTNGKLRLLPRRCLENFAIDATAIAQMLKDDSEFTEVADEQRVRDALIDAAKLDGIRGSKIFKGDLKDERWLSEVDGAKLLRTAIAQLSNNTFEFRKTLHTPVLLSLVGEPALRPLLDLLEERVKFISDLGAQQGRAEPH